MPSAAAASARVSARRGTDSRGRRGRVALTALLRLASGEALVRRRHPVRGACTCRRLGIGPISCKTLYPRIIALCRDLHEPAVFHPTAAARDDRESRAPRRGDPRIYLVVPE